MTQYNFSEKTRDYLDRLCRLTDGAGADRYTLFEFLELLNQNAFYRVYQPKLPTDVGLFKFWHQKLIETGRVQFLLNSQVVKLNKDLSVTLGNNQ